jgi:hypothetical protein
VAQNQVVTISKTAPGETRFIFNRIKPALATPLLIGFPIHALLGDSSRRVRFSIKDIQLEGCPSEFSVLEDSITICQCYANIHPLLDTVAFFGAGAEVNIPIRIERGLTPPAGLIGSLRVRPPRDLDLVAVDAGPLIPAGSLTWTTGLDHSIEIVLPNSAAPNDTAGTLAILRMRPRSSATARIFTIEIDRTMLWQQCCIAVGPDAMTIVLDGACEHALVRSAAPTVTTMPNPLTGASPVASVTVTIPAANRSERSLLHIMDSEGKVVRTLSDGVLAEGAHVFPFDAHALPAGRYYAVLQSRGALVTRPIVWIP